MDNIKKGILKITPKFIKILYQHIKVKWRFRGGTIRIDTDSIHVTAMIGKHVWLAKGVDIRQGVYIGDYSYCSPGTIVFNGTQIGRYCSIGYNVQIGCPEHPYHFFTTSPTIYKDNRIARHIPCWPSDDFLEPIYIGNDVWIGSNAIILHGVHIGDGAVIAAGAVVTKDVEAYSIVGGVPARKLRKRFNEDIEKKIQESNWWDMDLEDIRHFADSLYWTERNE